MNTRVPRAYFLVPVAYIALIGLLVYAQFSGSVRVHETVQHLTLEVELAGASRGNGTIESLLVSADGVQLEFSQATPVELRLGSGERLQRYISAYALTPNEIELSFGSDLSVMIHAAGEGLHEARVRFRVGLPDVDSVVVPFELSREVLPDFADHLPLVTVRDSETGATSMVALSAGSNIRRESREFVASRLGDGFGEILLSGPHESSFPAGSMWFSSHYDFELETAYEETLESYRRVAYEGWSETRYSDQDLRWSMPEGGRRFEERILVYYLAESHSRGESQEALRRMRSATVQQPEALSHLSAAYLGDIVNQDDSIQAAGFAVFEQLRQDLELNSPEVFTIDRLLHFAIDRAPITYIQQIQDLASAADIAGASLEVLLGMLGVLLESDSFGDEFSSSFEMFLAIPEQILRDSIVLTPSGLFLETRPGRSDVGMCLRAGTLLLEAGRYQGLDTAARVGRELVVSALNLRDEDGMLPAVVSFDDGRLINREGTLAPERVYEIMTPAAFLPREVTFYGVTGAGTWMWTVAEDVSLQGTGEALRLQFRFPVGETHFFIVKGLRPFSSIQMLGVPWPSDPRFQAYTSGWLYLEEKQTLYVKITHRSEVEELVVEF